uniref:uncharacterized protein LOC120820845 n=1 Tax=Gasterosteus aculeatus aculeatus TaxID=481459 RepID=UPI001A99068F|nr:uncharacterized protein LOC120820845 [Gasterosteus aculeatus aculeatus]
MQLDVGFEFVLDLHLCSRKWTTVIWRSSPPRPAFTPQVTDYRATVESREQRACLPAVVAAPRDTLPVSLGSGPAGSVRPRPQLRGVNGSRERGLSFQASVELEQQTLSGEPPVQLSRTSRNDVLLGQRTRFYFLFVSRATSPTSLGWVWPASSAELLHRELHEWLLEPSDPRAAVKLCCRFPLRPGRASRGDRPPADGAAAVRPRAAGPEHRGTRQGHGPA